MIGEGLPPSQEKVYTQNVMAPLISCLSLSKAFPPRTLFKDLSLHIFAGDRVGLVGLNGSGKSTLLQMLAGKETPDSGEIASQRGLKIGYLPQTCEFADAPLKSILLKALQDQTEMAEYEKELLVEIWLSKFEFPDKNISAQKLSGGWKKRLGLARELIGSPDLLLLDEPTNHLDLEAVLWLEKFLLREAPTYLLVSHDRYFLQNVVNRTIEIDKVYPTGLFSIDGTYSEFLAKKEEFLQGQLQQERSIATKARRETEWLKAGVKARTTKSQARIDEAEEILEMHRDIKERNRQTSAKIDFAGTERETRKLLTAKNLQKEAGGKVLFRHLDFLLSPGTRLGLMGPNGSGKTTLLKLIAGELIPDMGTIKRAEGLQVVYFDQHRAQIPLDFTLKEALSPKGDYVEFRGQRIHVNGWCKRFLFSPDLLSMPIHQLSGGERARIAIAHLMLQSADLLLLDEPTNDLDIPTLEALEESLLDFPGAIVLITHDRCMIDRLCNSLLSLGNPDHVEIYSEYSQWESSLKKEAPKKEKTQPKPLQPKKPKKDDAAIEKKILQKEEEVRALNHRLEQIADDPKALSEICTQIGILETQIEQLYLQWAKPDAQE